MTADQEITSFLTNVSRDDFQETTQRFGRHKGRTIRVGRYPRAADGSGVSLTVVAKSGETYKDETGTTRTIDRDSTRLKVSGTREQFRGFWGIHNASGGQGRR